MDAEPFIVGGALMAFAATLAISMATDSQADPGEMATAMGLVYGVPGVALAKYGAITWLGSKRRAGAREGAPDVIPLLAPPDQAYPA